MPTCRADGVPLRPSGPDGRSWKKTSMRTERTTRQSRCHTTFLHVRDLESGTVTASDRGSRLAAAPILLPQSDTDLMLLPAVNRQEPLSSAFAMPDLSAAVTPVAKIPPRLSCSYQANRGPGPCPAIPVRVRAGLRHDYGPERRVSRWSGLNMGQRRTPAGARRTTGRPARLGGQSSASGHGAILTICPRRVQSLQSEGYRARGRRGSLICL